MLVAAVRIAILAAAPAQMVSSAPAAPVPPPAAAAVPTPAAARILALPDEAIAYIPARAALSLSKGGPHPPLLVLLHGAGRDAGRMIERLASEADARGIVLLAPTSRGPTWDKVASAEEPPDMSSQLASSMARRFSTSHDADRVEAAIAALGKILPVDRNRTVLAGFSDGATFALAMGLSRAHAFAGVIAWSPGIAIETVSPARGRRVFVSHGRADPVLSFTTACADIVPMVQGEGAAVTFLPFEGGHEMTPAATDAFLDVLFGAVPGQPVHPLPRTVERCMRPEPERPM